MSLIQAKRKTSVTVTQTFRNEDAPSDLDSGVPTVVSTAPDGTTTTYNAGTTPAVQGTWTGRTTGQYRLVLSGPLEVTKRHLEWTGNIGGEPQTLEDDIEWIGVDLFNISTFRELRVPGGYPFAADATPLISTAKIMETRAAILDEMQQILGYSPVPRFAREDLDGGGGPSVQLVDPGVEAHHPPLSVTVNGVVQSVAGYRLGSDGVLATVSGYSYGAGITRGLRNVVVEYRHGTARPPGDGSRMAMLWAGAMLNPSGFSNATSVSLPTGETWTSTPAEIGRSGFQRHTPIQEVNLWLHRWSRLAVA